MLKVTIPPAKGPWQVIPCDFYAKGGGTVQGFTIISAYPCVNLCSLVPGENTDRITPAAYSNAVLMAAAPELLEALEQAITRIPANSKDTWDIKALLVARAAIKKAKGGQE